MTSPAPEAAAVRALVAEAAGLDPQVVTEDLSLIEAGIDSIGLVELLDRLEERTGRRVPDAALDGLRTVGDVERAVTGPSVLTLHLPERPPSSPFTRLALWFVGAGVAIGLLVGLLGSSVIGGLGLGDVNLPPVAQPTTAPTPTPTATPTPTPTATLDEASPDPTFIIERPQVAPGERFVIRGRFPDLPANAILSVEVRDEGASEWDDFAGVQLRTQADGSFETRLFTSRTGVREFRVRAVDSGQVSPAARVRIG